MNEAQSNILLHVKISGYKNQLSKRVVAKLLTQAPPVVVLEGMRNWLSPTTPPIIYSLIDFTKDSNNIFEKTGVSFRKNLLDWAGSDLECITSPAF